MQVMTKRMNVLLLVMCLLASLAFGNAVAWADDSAQSGEDSLTVRPIDPNNKDKTIVEDIATANVQVDVYKVADATKSAKYDSYDYSLASPYAGLEDRLKAALDPKVTTSNWQDFSNAAAELVFSGAEGTAGTLIRGDLPVNEALAGLADGLYLVIPHGQGVTPKSLDGTVASSAKYDYAFQVTTVALPNKDDLDGDETPTSAASDGDWQKDVEIMLKPEWAPIPTPTPVPETVSITVTKSWNDSDDKDGIRPSSVEMKLYAGNTLVESASPITLNEGNNWKGTWENLPKKKDGKTIEYTVKETKTSVITGVDGSSTYRSTVKKNSNSSFTVTNTHTPKKKSSTTTTKTRTVRTGDDRNLLPFYITMVVSGALLLAFGVSAVRRRNRRG